jgi:hypothetical protein
MVNQSERRILLDKLIENRQTLVNLIWNLSNEQLIDRKQDGDRTPKGMIFHIADTENNYVWNWAKRSRDEKSPDLSNKLIKSNAENGIQVIEEANEWDTELLIEKLRTIRESTLRFIAETNDNEFNAIGKNSPFGDMTVHQFLKSLYRHDQMHINELTGKEQTIIITGADGKQL